MLSLLLTPLLCLTFSVLPPNQLKKPKTQKKWTDLNRKKSGWGKITYFLQSDVDIFWFSFWLSSFLFSSAKWKPFVQAEIGYLTAIVVLNKKEIKNKSSQSVCFPGVTQPTLLL